MQRLFIMISFLFCGAVANASCAGNGIWCWPNNSTIKSNPVIVLTFYLKSQDIIAGLNAKHAIYLKAGEQKIKLLVVEVCKGQFRLTQVIVKPAAKLTPGVEYELVIDSLPEFERIRKWNKETAKYWPVKWKVLPEADTGFPAWVQLPKFNSKSLFYWGCGPSTSVDFDFAAEDASDILVKTTLKNIRTGKYTTCYVEPAGNKISVGHSMCSGLFNFDDGDEYEVSFALMDASGNPGYVSTLPTRFTRPTDKDQPK